ncbi:hypothetical protein C0Q70_18158 [Pomacea canaliculata]|uniref:Ubiquitin-related modifier 1 homolog n=1 Tax=Pomacea canaliculata TaxID=400727 RepID=A0A2T7NMF6_POMCA|nr:hypothetical protein C0Q70_18158 [Pomacea canaliculata]
MAIPITLEFSGGAELLFNNVKKHDVELQDTQKWTISNLLIWIKENLLKERPELFIQGATVRPGILVLVNDTDWELMSVSIYSGALVHEKNAQQVADVKTEGR